MLNQVARPGVNPRVRGRTTRIGTGKSPGSFESRACSAAGPPVDVATATTRTRLPAGTGGGGGSATGAGFGRQCRTTFTCDIALTVATSSFARRGNSGDSGPGGFEM